MRSPPLVSGSFEKAVVDRLRSVIGDRSVGLHEPSFLGNEWNYVKDCLDTGWVSSAGGYVDRLERDLAAYTGASHAVLVNNGTSGLQVALHLVGVGLDDEVMVPALSFVATANAVRHCGAWPHFVDSDYSSLGVSVPALADHLAGIARQEKNGCFNKLTGRRIAAIVPMHTFGHPADMHALMKLAASYGIAVVEDAAESLGSSIEGRHTGTFGRCGVFSFNGNKIVTTGGGGAIVTDDPELAFRAKHLTTTAKQPHKWAFFHDDVAFNFRLPNLNAALGCAQLEQLPNFLAAKRELTRRYAVAFDDLRGASVFLERSGARSNYWLQTLLLDVAKVSVRERVLAAINDAGFMARPAWNLLNTLPMYTQCPSMPLPVATKLACQIVNLPSSSHLVEPT